MRIATRFSRRAHSYMRSVFERLNGEGEDDLAAYKLWVPLLHRTSRKRVHDSR